MATPINTILSWFVTGSYPTQEQFAATILSLFHKDEKIPIESVNELSEILGNFVTSQQFENHIADTEAHGGTFVKLDASNMTEEHIRIWLNLLGILYAATIDGEETEGNVYTKEQVNDIADGMKGIKDELEEEIETIKQTLLSNDINLDELQEIVNYVKANRELIEELQAVVIGLTDDDKVSLKGDYLDWGTLTLQNQFNDIVFDKIKQIEAESALKYEATITENSTLVHNLDTYDLICEAYDTVTMYTTPIRIKRTDKNTVIIEFDSEPENEIKIKIKKI